MRQNFYNTEDPELLLRLKRQEADALRDVLRSINMSQLKTRQIFKIAQNTLMAQLGVRKMRFVYRTEEGFQDGIVRGIGELDAEAKIELPRSLSIMQIDPLTHTSLHKLGVEFVVPINFRNEVNAWFLVANFAETEAETENDLIFIETIGNIISTALENRALIREMVQQESLRRELEVAERIQQQLLTQDFTIVKEADIYARNVAHHKIGGDYYDIIPRGEGGYFLCIADVAGKGIGAALLMANLQANLRALIVSEDNLESVIRKLHKLLIGITQGEKFVTFFLGYVRPDGRMDYINAGHNPPVHIHDGQLETLPAGTIPLGIVDLPHVSQSSIQLAPGDTLFLYTDGLVEQHDKDGVMLEEEPVHKRLLEIADWTARDIIDDLQKMYDAHSAKAIQDDDVTMMAVRV